MRIALTESHVPKQILVLVTGVVQLNLVVLSVGKHDVKYAFGGPKGKIMGPRGEAEEARWYQRMNHQPAGQAIVRADSLVDALGVGKGAGEIYDEMREA